LQREVQNILDALNQLLGELVAAKKSEVISVNLIQRFHEMVGKAFLEKYIELDGQEGRVFFDT
jgi:hypothetical protein